VHDSVIDAALLSWLHTENERTMDRSQAQEGDGAYE
jgi:hypothetical protein